MDTIFAICDNAANTHIYNDKRMFTNLSASYSNNTVATIGSKNSTPLDTGTVKWT